jgi:glycosyltransferase involved in cell wall biosynthesis
MVENGLPRVSVLLPVVDETDALRQTMEILLREDRVYLHEVLILTGKPTTAEAWAVCREIESNYPGFVRIIEQKLPRLGGAMRAGFDAATGSHVLMMASDLETEPATVLPMIEAALDGADIVTATRWTRRGAIKGYQPLKFVLNWIFQHLVGAAYGTHLSDLTFGFRMFRSEWVKKIRWEEVGHPFLLETVLKPLRLGARVVEVPTTWRPRPEGVSHNGFFRNFVYFRIAFRVRFMPRNAMLTGAIDEHRHCHDDHQRASRTRGIRQECP